MRYNCFRYRIDRVFLDGLPSAGDSVHHNKESVLVKKKIGVSFSAVT